MVYLQDKSKADAANQGGRLNLAAPDVAYRLQPGDVIFVGITKVNATDKNLFEQAEQLSASARQTMQHPYLVGYPIDDSGRVQLPLLGAVPVAGKTIDQARLGITEAATGVYVQPVVRIFLLNFMVTVLGEVAQPGRYPVYTRQASVLDAVGMAGDILEFGNRRNVKILRHNGGQQLIYHLDLTDAATAANAGFYLQPGDIVMVPPLKSRKFANRGVQWTISALGAAALVLSLLINLNR